MKKTTDPPRLAIWLLTRRLSAEWRDFVVGDLEEEFATRSGDSPVAGRRLVLVADDALPGCAATRSPQSIAAWIVTRRLEDAYLVCRSSLCVPGDVPDTLVRRCGRQRAGAWHRREHRDLQHRERGPAASAAFRGAGTPGADLHQDTGPGRWTLRALARQVLRLAAGCAVVRGHGDVPMLRLQGARAHRHGHRANSTCDSCERGLFRDRQSPAGARTRLSARGGHARRQVRGRPERPVLENRIRRQPGRDRPHGEAQRRSVHHRRCHAGHCLGRVMDRDGERRLGPARTHRRAARRPWESQSGRRRASEERCRTGAGASRDGRDLRTARA